MKSNMQKFDDTTSEILAEVTKAVKAARSEADKKRKEADKHTDKNNQGPYNPNHRSRNNTRDIRQNSYQFNSGGGRGSSCSHRNDIMTLMTLTIMTLMTIMTLKPKELRLKDVGVIGK